MRRAAQPVSVRAAEPSISGTYTMAANTASKAAVSAAEERAQRSVFGKILDY